MLDIIIDLHSKTMFTKEVREGAYKRIYEILESNILYYKDKYNRMIEDIEKEVFLSPSKYLFLRNSSILFNQINFCYDKLKIWYKNVKNLRSCKVCQVHNNLRLEHFINDKKFYLISWDKSNIDSPVIDIYNFYKNEALNLEFNSLLNKYFNSNIIDQNDKDLLLIMICMPIDINFEKTEIDSCKGIERAFDYVYKTEELVRPYYIVEKE